MKRQFPVIVLILMSIIGQAHAQVIWQKLNLPEAKIRNLKSTPNGKLYLIAQKSIYFSLDNGNSWTISNIKNLNLVDSEGVLYVQHDTLFSYSTDEGKTWNDSKLPFGSVYAEGFLATNKWIYIFSGGPKIRRTKDRGVHWEEVPFQTNGSDLTWQGTYASPQGSVFGSFQFDGSLQIFRDSLSQSLQTHYGCLTLDNDPIYGVSFDFDGYVYGDQDCRLIRSSDDGLHWSPIDSFPSSNRYWVPYLSIPKKGILSVNDSETVLSMDHSDTWQKIGKGIEGEIASYYHSSMTDRRGNAFIYNDTSLYRMSFYASVHSTPKDQEDITVYFDPKYNQISLQSQTPLGKTTASLYTIDGRLLNQTKLDISTPGIFSIDVSDVHTRFAILVLQTEKGIITKKILLSEP